MSYARNKRRQAHKMNAASEGIFEADRRFFERFPHRQHLVRYAAQAEIADLDESLRAMAGRSHPGTAQGYRWFAIVKQIAPGRRMRVFRQNTADTPIDLTEEQAAQVYDLVASDGHRVIEAEILIALRAKVTVH